MENEKQNKIEIDNKEIEVSKKNEFKLNTPMAIVLSAIIIAIGLMVGLKGDSISNQGAKTQNVDKKVLAFEESVLPSKGVTIPATWGDLGVQLVENGSIDKENFESLYKQRGQFTEEYNELLNGKNNGKIKITKDNAGYLLNLFWALGLSNKNEILEKGEMANPQYGGAGGFASTGGWTLAVGNPMDHYSKHQMITLTPEEQALVDKVSRGIYRPCCGNSVHFPDCNHGMAMLGLLELMASQGASEQEMWDSALIVNSYWFPDTYLTIAKYMEGKGIEWKNVNPVEVLGVEYSSNKGFQNISSQVVVPASSTQNGSGCDVGGGAQVATPQSKQSSGCDI